MNPVSSIIRNISGHSLASIVQILVILGLLAGVFLMADEIRNNASTVMIINRVKTYDTAVRGFTQDYGALPGDITAPKARIPDCQEMPCAAAGNGNQIIADRKPLLSTNYFFRDTSENRTFWLHLAKAGLISGIETEKSGKGRYFGQWGVEFPKAPIGVHGGFHVAYYSVTATAFSPVSLLGHYMVMRSSTDTYGVTVAPYVLEPVMAEMIDKKIDDGKPLSGRVVAPGSSNCATKAGEYNSAAGQRECNLLFQLSF